MKLVENCETLLFQRPDEAIHRGADAKAEADIASSGTLAQFRAITIEQAASLVDHVAEFDKVSLQSR